MKIALLHYSAPPVVGGVETVIARQAEQLVRAGHLVHIIAGRGQTWDARIPVDVLPHLDTRQPQVLKIRASLETSRIPPYFADLVHTIEGELQRSLAGTDVVIAHNVASLHKNLALTAALYNISQADRAPRMILWHHDLAWTNPVFQNEMSPGWPWDLLQKPWPGVQQVTVSETRQAELARLMNLDLSEITVIPDGIDLSTFFGLQPRTANLVETLQIAQCAPILLTPVRIARRKNLELTLETLAELRHDFPQAMLVVTGPPNMRNPANVEYLEMLQRRRRTLGLDGSAHFLAEYLPEGLTPAELADFYRLADVVLLPSREEGFGMPILEAGVSGLPIFCSDLPALRSLAGDAAEYFSPDEDPRRLAFRIGKALQNDPRYLLKARIRQEFTWEAVYRRMVAPLLERRA